MNGDALIDLLRSILAQPTAPFHEDAVRGEIQMQLAQVPNVTVEQDDFGNVIAQYRGCSEYTEYAFAAHMDHPGYLLRDPVAAPAGGEYPEWEFLGGVPEAYRARKPPVRDFGPFAMWDLPPFDLRDGQIHSRACDDLIGCAAIVALFHRLAERKAEANVYGLFSRAEEVGFVGAIRLAQSGLVPKDLTIVSLECSSEKSPGAGRMGDGVIVRVGDRTSVFDDAATAAFVQAASEAKIPFQRCLMSGGTCEATAYQLYGYRTAALCVALGNYHNCGPDTTIAPEFVALADVEGMIQLMEVAATRESSCDPHRALRERLEKRVEEHRRYWE